MKIVGYSERGAMNALFYGIALDQEHKGIEAMKEFLKLACIEDAEGFSDFELYPEFSLSDFGEPDLMIKAKFKNKDSIMFFIEAKVSANDRYDLKTQKDIHDSYLKDHAIHSDGHSSNLFYQFKLKNYFFQLKDCFSEESRLKIVQERIDKNIDPAIVTTGNRHRKIGKNGVVNWIVNDVIKECVMAKYIAIIPEKKSNIIDCGFQIHCVSWQEIFDNPILKDYVYETIISNKQNGISQILNNEPKSRRKKHS
ncbi:MAG: hypothetical protein K5920_11115 [Bacteroidales bacterium]|nr:hypothetical protein [Bacteroidales bacterium]